jgi:lipopolysaccharide export system protein LptC
MPDASAKAATALPASMPDYVLNQARVERFDAQGNRVALMQGRLMNHYALNDRLQVSALYLVAQNPNGQARERTLEAWAKDGLYSGDRGDIELLGQARVMTSDASASPANVTTFTGEQLHWQPREQLLSTDRPVVLQSPRGTVRGARLRHDANTGLSDLSGRVTGLLLPKP